VTDAIGGSWSNLQVLTTPKLKWRGWSKAVIELAEHCAAGGGTGYTGGAIPLT
jgi:FAD/FMN-containing dehydrogenase